MIKIADEDEVQLRQVHPIWMEGAEPSRLAFMPTRKDEGKLSLDRSATTTAKSSFDDFKALGLKSDAVFGITPSEMAAEPNPIDCFESPLAHNPHHSHADFAGLSNSQQKEKEK